MGDVTVGAGGPGAVWVFAEQRDGGIRGVSFELLSEGRKLAEALGRPLAAVCLGDGVRDVEQLIAHGADTVYLIDDPALAHPLEDTYAPVLLRLIREHAPDVVLAGATALGRALLPRVATALGTGLTADCTGLEIDPDTGYLLQTKPSYGGNVMAVITCPTHRPQMATVRPRVFPRVPRPDHRGEVIRVDLAKEAVTGRTKLLDFVAAATGQVDFDESDVIVAGGRGAGSAEGMARLAELAETLGAALGASRPPVDEDWLPYAHQIGQTGKTVAPKLYIACGISGQIQHLAGMQTAECIVAINQDPQAPIFDVAHYGIVGDLFAVLPVLVRRLKEG